MAVVSTPPSMSSVISVFGGPNNLTAYYRGGPYVPNTARNAAINTSPGSLALSQFAGTNNYIDVGASVSPNTATASTVGNTHTSTVITLASPTAAGSGGTGSYTYSWVFVSGDNTITAVSPTAASTKFSASITDPSGSGVTKNGVYKCTVSDGTTSANTPNVSISLTYTYDSGA